ncbi:hypothetical protein [Methanoregula sp.]|uniref:hypothetical protein n=1 Tax=Methanoregula sp. TaxID=2052170 RepID=UPI00356414AA
MHQSSTLYEMMIDTWLLAVFFLALLTLGALLRVVRIKSRFDRLVAAIVAISLGAATGLLVSIAFGNLLVLNITVILVLICFAVLIAGVRFRGETA